jgi:hypothetical protein
MVRNSGTQLLPVLFQLVPKIMVRNSKIANHNYWQLEREFVFWKRLFIGIKRFLHPFVPDISQHSGKTDPKQERRGITQLEKRLKKNNSRIGREIKDLLGVFFLLLFSHVVLLFKHESLYKFWYDNSDDLIVLVCWSFSSCCLWLMFSLDWMLSFNQLYVILEVKAKIKRWNWIFWPKIVI